LWHDWTHPCLQVLLDSEGIDAYDQVLAAVAAAKLGS
jgi:hypothetical protein